VDSKLSITNRGSLFVWFSFMGTSKGCAEVNHEPVRIVSCIARISSGSGRSVPNKYGQNNPRAIGFEAFG
jgi:hypothetical protein